MSIHLVTEMNTFGYIYLSVGMAYLFYVSVGHNLGVLVVDAVVWRVVRRARGRALSGRFERACWRRCSFLGLCQVKFERRRAWRRWRARRRAALAGQVP